MAFFRESLNTSISFCIGYFIRVIRKILLFAGTATSVLLKLKIIFNYTLFLKTVKVFLKEFFCITKRAVFAFPDNIGKNENRPFSFIRARF
ncbi:MAG TPA: hypothetical protein DCL49_12765 [Candidatus Omnitrophica bacterium]|nr:MAG: hypothetical protein A2460_08295 [Omnitrophica WOR_2 bacterium RIFOXYC2_FULL_43_9]HAH21755.1 hypothetical protein [Candidatus Omnitrophota bacterium]HCD38087.1 hypothetical protein [Candidatus Omnitrophota bacterium]